MVGKKRGTKTHTVAVKELAEQKKGIGERSNQEDAEEQEEKKSHKLKLNNYRTTEKEKKLKLKK